MNTKRHVMWRLLFLLVSFSLLMAGSGCATPTAEMVEKVITQIVKETVIVQGTPEIVEKEVTKVVEVEKVVTPTPAPQEEVTLVVAVSNQYSDNFDIFNTAYTMEPHTMIYEPLVSVDYDYKFQPGLAKSWEISEDGLTWTFHLREGVTFHDGSEFNAEVVKWWLEGMQQGVSSYMFEPMTEAQVIDNHTIALKFEVPFPNLLYNLSTSFSGIMSKEAYEKYGEEYGTKHPTGTGPFMLKEWVQNDHLLLVKNPDYNWAPEWANHKGPAKVDKILYRIIPEDATRTIELQAGSVHLVLSPPPARELIQYKDNPDYTYHEVSDSMVQYIAFNVDAPFFKDLRARKAVGYAIDRDLILETVYQDLGRPTNTYLSGELGGDKGVGDFAPSYDPDKAAELLAEAGWALDDDGILVAESVEGVDPGTKLEVDYWTYQEDEFRRLAEVTRKMLADIGIQANIVLMDNPTYDAQLKSRDYQIILRQYGWDNNDILEWFHHSKYFPYPNHYGVRDPQLDAMLDEANFNMPTWEERDAKYVEIHKYLIDEWYPWAPIRQPAAVVIGRSTVKDFRPIPLRATSSSVVWTKVYLEQE